MKNPFAISVCGTVAVAALVVVVFGLFYAIGLAFGTPGLVVTWFLLVFALFFVAARADIRDQKRSGQ